MRPICTSWRIKTFDLVVSIFGAMFAPKPFDVAKEMVRVTRPGGRIVMGNWIPNDPTLVAQILKISAAYSPPPPEGFISPMTWGIEGQRDRAVRRCRRSAGEGLASPGTRLRSTSPTPRPRFVEAFRNYYGPDHERVRGSGKERQAAILRRSWTCFSRARTRAAKDVTSIPATFLRVMVFID